MTPISPLSNLIRTGRVLTIKAVPIAEPRMMCSSAGCIKTMIGPFSIKKPPRMAPITTTIPMIANMYVVHIGQRAAKRSRINGYSRQIRAAALRRLLEDAQLVNESRPGQTEHIRRESFVPLRPVQSLLQNGPFELPERLAEIKAFVGQLPRGNVNGGERNT